MKQYWYTLLVFVFFLTGVRHSDIYAQGGLNSINFVYRYDPNAELFVNYSISRQVQTDSLELTCQLVLNDANAEAFDYQFSLYHVGSYEEKLTDQLPLKSTYLGSRMGNHFWTFSFLPVDISEIYVLQVTSNLTQIQYFYDILPNEIAPLKLKDASGIPIIKPWIRPTEVFEAQRAAIGLHYKNNFKPSLPPMVTRDPTPAKTIEIDSIFSVEPSDRFELSNLGLNLFQKDTSENEGLALLSVDKYFPKPAKLEHLIAPLIYITTKEEWARLNKPGIEKKDFDSFWLDMTRSQERARKIIKRYYDRVEEANQFFTTYKEGWKTDKGLIYIVFGLPDRIIRSKDKEVWQYDSSPQAPAIAFDFLKVNTVFSAQHYALVREKRYANSWFRMVNILRKARF